MKHLLLLIKPVSGSCNMRCRYCFYADVTSNRREQNRGIMSHETLETLVRKALSETTELCVFGFQGGEPTLAGLDFYRALIGLEQKYNVNGVSIRHSIQTNGLLLNEEWCAFLARHNFLVGLSLDGPKGIHDLFRLDASGKETHTRCLKAAQMLSKHNVEYNILTVVTRQIAAHPDKTYNFFKKHGFRHLQLIPCLDGFEEKQASNRHSLDSKQYGDFLCRVFDLWYDDYMKNDYYSIRSFDNFIYMLAGYPPENCAACGTCSANPLVEADGSVYPCDFYALDSYYLGNVASHSFQEMLSGCAAMEFVGVSRHTHEECGGCPYHFLCRGGCRRDREPAINGQLGLNAYCAAYKQFLAYVLPRMAKIAQSFHAAR